MKKNTFKILIAMFILVISLFIYQLLFKPHPIEGSKQITITAVDRRDDQETTVIKSTVINTDAQYLGEVLDEINIQKQTFELTGNKKDQFGRLLVSINDVKQNPSANQFWMYESTTNKECKAAGFCTGVDLLPIYDQDSFVFIIK